MSPLPHFFGLDFSGAGPWLLAGLLAGILISWLWRALRGSRIDSQAQAKIGEIEALLDNARRDHQADVARLLSDTRNFEQALADAERRAAASAEKAARLTLDVEKLSKADVAARNDLLAADNELAKLRSSLQWSETQAKSLAQERQALETRLSAFTGERQNLAAEIATVKTAAELKDAEIARLINQAQWHENRAKAMEKDVQALAVAAASLAQRDADVARLSAELQSAQAALARTQGDLGAATASLANLQAQPAQLQSLETVQAKYDQAWKDLTYMRNLAYWQTSEIDRLRKAITAHEETSAQKDANLAALARSHADLKAKAARRAALVPPSGGIALGGAGRVIGVKGAAAPANVRPQRLPNRASPSSARTASARAKASKLGKAVAAAKPAGSRTKVVANGHAGVSSHTSSHAGILASRRVAFAELQALREKVAQLSADAAMYRRLREALDTANRIANPSA